MYGRSLDARASSTMLIRPAPSLIPLWPCPPSAPLQALVRMYSRSLDARKRHHAQAARARADKEVAQLSICTFSPSIDGQSRRIAAAGARSASVSPGTRRQQPEWRRRQSSSYDGSVAHAGAEEEGPGLQLLGSAGGGWSQGWGDEGGVGGISDGSKAEAWLWGKEEEEEAMAHLGDTTAAGARPSYDPPRSPPPQWMLKRGLVNEPRRAGAAPTTPTRVAAVSAPGFFPASQYHLAEVVAPHDHNSSNTTKRLGSGAGWGSGTGWGSGAGGDQWGSSGGGGPLSSHTSGGASATLALQRGFPHWGAFGGISREHPFPGIGEFGDRLYGDSVRQVCLGTTKFTLFDLRGLLIFAAGSLILKAGVYFKVCSSVRLQSIQGVGYFLRLSAANASLMIYGCFFSFPLAGPQSSQRIKLETVQRQRQQEEQAMREFKARPIPPAVAAAATAPAHTSATGPTGFHAGGDFPSLSRAAAGRVAASTASLESSPACRLYEPRGLRTPASLKPYLRSPHPECTFNPRTNFGRRMAGGRLAPRCVEKCESVWRLGNMCGE